MLATDPPASGPEWVPLCPSSCLPHLCWVPTDSFPLTLNLTAVGRSAHTFFKGQLKKSLNAKNLQKIPIPQKMPAESKSRIKYPSKNVILCLFYASEQAKVPKKAT